MSDDDELARLRRRAYGPDADIDRDPVARARLHELEAALRAERAAPVVPSAPPPVPDLPASVALAVGAPRHPGPPPSASPADDANETASAPPRATRRTLVAACVVTALASVAVAVPATLGASALLNQPDAVLRPDDDAAAASYFGNNLAEGSRSYDDFYGLQIAAGSFEGSTDTCLLVRVSAEQGTGACSPLGLDPTCDLAARDASALIRKQFGDDAVLRFVVSGDDVQVYVVHPEPVEEPVDGA